MSGAVKDAYVPEPDTHYPHYAAQADGIRSLLAAGHRYVHVAEIQRPNCFMSEDSATEIAPTASRRRTMAIKKCAGGAPFVGDPLFHSGVYWWRAAIDEVGRHVAGSAALEIYWDPKF